MGDLHIESWLPFFGSLAQVSGGLVGLVFVALTFKPDMLGEAGDVGLRTLVGQTFADFLNVLFVSLMMQVPEPHDAWRPSFVGLIGAVGSVRAIASLVRIWRAGSGRVARGPITQRLVLSLSGNVALMAACGVAHLGPQPIERFWGLVCSGLIVLVLSGCRSALLLVTHDAK